MDSGFFASSFSSDLPSSNTAGVARSLNCSGNDSNATLTCLKNIPLETLLQAAFALAKALALPNGLGAFVPVIDGDFMPKHPSILVREGSFVKGEVIRYVLPGKLTSLQASHLSLPGLPTTVPNLFPHPLNPKPQLSPYIAARTASPPATSSSRSIR